MKVALLNQIITWETFTLHFSSHVAGNKLDLKRKEVKLFRFRTVILTTFTNIVVRVST